MRRFSHSEDVVAKLNPRRPCFLFRPHEVDAAARCFLNEFSGIAHYAVKCNPNRELLQTIWDAGLHSFEVASIEEVRLIREMWSMATLRFMHPVKYPCDVREAYQVHGVRDFAVDHIGQQVDVHKYAVQITVADVRDGACSSSTLREACSWGKVGVANEQMVFAEATSVMPLIASAVFHRANWATERPRRRFDELFVSE